MPEALELSAAEEAAILERVFSGKKQNKNKNRGKRPRVKLAAKDDNELTLEGTDLEIFKKRFKDLTKRSLLVKFTNPSNSSEKILKKAPSVMMGRGGFRKLIFKSEEKALKMQDKLKKNPDVEVMYEAGEEIDVLVVDPYVISVQNVPKDATKDDMKKQFPNAGRINFSPMKKTCLIYDKKEEAAEDFKRENIEINELKVSLLYRIVYEKSNFTSTATNQEDEMETDEDE